MTNSSTVSGRSVRFWWRITRYDPSRRDDRGAYQDETWTSISDVGAVFDDEELTLAEYERVEAAYIAAFTAFAEESNVGRLQIRDLERGQDLVGGAMVSLSEASQIVGQLLREEAICKLEAPGDEFALHVGFDLYMYIGSAHPCIRAMEYTRSLGLFVEGDSPSPQLVEDQ